MRSNLRNFWQYVVQITDEQLRSNRARSRRNLDGAVKKATIEFHLTESEAAEVHSDVLRQMDEYYNEYRCLCDFQGLSRLHASVNRILASRKPPQDDAALAKQVIKTFAEFFDEPIPQAFELARQLAELGFGCGDAKFGRVFADAAVALSDEQHKQDLAAMHEAWLQEQTKN